MRSRSMLLHCCISRVTPATACIDPRGPGAPPDGSDTGYPAAGSGGPSGGSGALAGGGGGGGAAGDGVLAGPLPAPALGE
jgi:hypothetical protein